MDTIFRFPVGDIQCLALRDSGDDEDTFRNSLLVQTGQHTVLIDPGTGRDLRPQGFLLDSLQTAQISPAEIDVVLVSHADWDHIGGAADASGNAVFPQARYAVPRQEWSFWHSRPERLRLDDDFEAGFRRLSNQLPVERLAQLADRVELVEPNAEIAPGIRSIPAPGHTPGNTLVGVASAGRQLLYIGDLFFEPDEIADPDWYSAFDFDPPQAILTRRRVFEQAAQDNTLLMAYHLPFPGLGHVSPLGQGWRWQASNPTV